MAAVITFLVLAILTINAVRSDQCGTVATGHIHGRGIPLHKTILQPGTADWEVSIPPSSVCPHGIDGVKAIVCDYDVLPTGQFLDMMMLLVHRIGTLQGIGSVSFTVYCKNTQHPQPWLLNNRWPSQDFIQPQWQNKKPGHDHNQLWVTPSNLWDQKPEGLIARPQ